jgi:predicted transcriptional regulator
MQRESRAVLISVHPKYVKKIIDGSKRVEFRRVWAARDVTHLVIYSTSPEMRVKAIAEVNQVIIGNKTTLWEIAKEYGGGLTRRELRDYFTGVSEGYAVLLGGIKAVENPITLTDVVAGMRPPQSFVYLKNEQFESIQAMTI